MGEALLIRPAVLGDLPALVDILNHYVFHGHATFNTVQHTTESRRPWFESYGDGRYQLLVASAEGQIMGYTSSNQYRSDPAFDTTVETSICLHPEQLGRGIGSALYTALFDRLARQPIHVAIAAVALPNEASLALHRKMGFEEVGTFKEYGRKRDKWISSTWFQRWLSYPVGHERFQPPGA